MIFFFYPVPENPARNVKKRLDYRYNPFRRYRMVPRETRPRAASGEFYLDISIQKYITTKYRTLFIKSTGMRKIRAGVPVQSGQRGMTG